MNRNDLETAIEWAAEEGWNPGLYDGDPFYLTDPNGFFIGELDGEPVSCISAVAYDDTYGFIGFYIVKPGHRGNGYGYAIWKHAMQYLGGRRIGLDGVVAQQANYQKSGFHLAYRNRRYEGRAEGKASSKLVPAREIPLERIVEFDDRCHPVSRRRFLNAWLMMPNASAYGMIQHGELTGFGVIRSCYSGFKIGPLYATSDEGAEELLRGLLQHAKGEPFYLDTPEVNASAVALAERLGMTMVFETARMYTKEDPAVSIGEVFGVTTFELG
ncbi:MAG: GNAT family N-acetyltransferase [bacterium]|nr:GNAT family N-acetyltransferase [bacterium]